MDHPPDLAQTPAAAPPPGQMPNFVNPPSQQAAMIAVSTVMMALTLTFVSLRLYNSLWVTKKPGIEDWLCVLAMIFSFTYAGIVLDLSFVSRHMWDVPLIWFTENYWKAIRDDNTQIRFAGNTIQAFAYFTSRLPILILYLRLFGRNQSFRILCYGGMAADFAIYLTAVPLLSYFCTPPIHGGDWNSLDVFAKCKQLLDWAVIQGSLDIALNVYIFILPLPTVLNLHMAPGKKLGVLAIFLTGLLAVVASGVGFYYRHQLSFTPDVNWNEGAYICMS
ncbi:hypothetical protein QBC46DRAFT_273902 [Diplogelasinospora grovesii]|uniref:Rhodopsin domain-containing protein n=1 Tax=Diplogelasinospora grovesii TaxID=303347 RepID=A0AAN6MY54_9PEZI|nr:hypothetical protein QBC46DRAFT_273902 [Diplogelasinospora grovesii]